MPILQQRANELPRARLISALSQRSPWLGSMADFALPGSLSDPTLGMMPVGFVNFGKSAGMIGERASDPLFTLAEQATHDSIIGDAITKLAGVAARRRLLDATRERYGQMLVDQERNLERFVQHLAEYKARYQ